MFDNLIESKAKSKKSLGQTAMSLVIHGLVIFAAVKATTGVAEEISKPKDTTLVFLKPPEPPKPVEQPPPPDVVVSPNPPPKGFQTVVPPDIIPKEIPPVDLNQKPFNAADFTGKGVEGGIANGVEGGTPREVKGEVFLEAQLDDPVEVINRPAPRFPPVMASAGIEGTVDLQFIVDTDGNVEPASIKILASSNKAFEEPARESTLKSKFKPAKFKGTPVRQLVQQRVRFSLSK